jgi:beta-mannosidase
MTFPITTTLDGTWQLRPTDTFRQGFYPLDDATWLEQDLPAHWQQHPLLESYAGKVVYRKRFALQGIGDGSWGLGETPPTPTPHPLSPMPRYWLRLNGTFYWSQPYFNGVDLGRHEGYFAAQEHEVTRWLAAENTLLVEVDCPEERDMRGKRMIAGVFSHWDCIDPATNPGGIWLPVELIATGPTRVKQLLLHTQMIGDSTAELRYRAELDAAVAGDVILRWTITPKNFAGEIQVVEQRRSLAAGQQEIAGLLDVRDPQLWWTHDLGHPSCYTIALAVIQSGEVSDERAETFGIRRFEMQKSIAYLNGVRLFIKGNNYAPGDTRIASMTSERYANDMRLVQECHMNMLRVHAHIDHPLFYEAANQAGILLWQDFPLQWLYRREVLPEARRQVGQMVRQLYNHPSLAIWCMHNEPLYVVDTKDESWHTRLRTYASVLLWSWNRNVLDTQLKRLTEQADRTRPAVRSSGEYSVPGLREGTDAHFYYGWYMTYGPLRRWESVVRRLPNTLRFATEFGTQSFPNLESSVRFMDADIAKIDWNRLITRHQFQANVLEHWIDWRAVGSLEELIRLTQDYQIAINRYYIDRLRFHKYRPTGGIIPFLFHDPNPAVIWSIVDYWRVPKRSYHAMRLAFSPQYVFTLLHQDRYLPGVAVDLPIYVVNDAHHASAVELTAQIFGPDGAELAAVERTLTLPADCMAMEVERLRLTPETPGTYQLALALRPEGGEAIAHEYDIVVAEPLAS